MNYVAALPVIGELERLEDRVNRIRFHEHYNSFEMLDTSSEKSFRITKNVARFVLNMVDPYLTAPTRNSALAKESKLLAALNFYGTGSYQTSVGSNNYIGISQPSVSRALDEVTEALNHPNIFNEWGHFPGDVESLSALRHEFFTGYGVPGLVGCIDCTHVALTGISIAEEGLEEHIFVNRKNYHSLNVQLICDTQLKILNINARYPGSTNDQFIWNNSNIKEFMVNLHENGQKGFYLLGDSGYTQRPWLHVPLPNAAPNTPEWRYNEWHRHTRNLIERCNGVFKGRFRCLLKHRVLHYKPTKAAKIANACAVLHNICRHFKLPEIPAANEENLDYGMYQFLNYQDEDQGRNRDLLAGRRLQQTIIQNYFN